MSRKISKELITESFVVNTVLYLFRCILPGDATIVRQLINTKSQVWSANEKLIKYDRRFEHSSHACSL